MTVIVYRDGVMAADSGGRTNDVIRNNCVKVHKCPVTGDLFGFAGNADSIGVFIDYVKSTDPAKVMPDIPKASDDLGRFIVLHVPLKVRVPVMITHYGRESYVFEPYVAIGAGAEVAIGALHAGADALDAVQAAIKHSPYCFGGVVYEALPRLT
jgi:hypothetical protein